jgi:hypothetical protein
LPGPPHEGVVAPVAEERVVAAVSDEAVVGLVALDVVVAGATQDGFLGMRNSLLTSNIRKSC